MKLAQAKTRIRARHCRVGQVTKKHSSQRLKGRVLSQTPKGGKVFSAGHRVNLKVGKG
jgi:beta-lactam-binding protein with PASTA domain